MKWIDYKGQVLPEGWYPVIINYAGYLADGFPAAVYFDGVSPASKHDCVVKYMNKQFDDRRQAEEFAYDKDSEFNFE